MPALARQLGTKVTGHSEEWGRQRENVQNTHAHGNQHAELLAARQLEPPDHAPRQHGEQHVHGARVGGRGNVVVAVDVLRPAGALDGDGAPRLVDGRALDPGDEHGAAEHEVHRHDEEPYEPAHPPLRRQPLQRQRERRLAPRRRDDGEGPAEVAVQEEPRERRLVDVPAVLAEVEADGDGRERRQQDEGDLGRAVSETLTIMIQQAAQQRHNAPTPRSESGRPARARAGA
ncbi:hypothetical protein VDGL01_06209 [Verticillium dahliae]